VAAHFDKISHMNMVGDMKRYAEFQTAQAIGDTNSGLHAAAQQGAMMGLVVNQLQSAGTQHNGDTLETKLQKLKDLFEKGLIDEGEYKAKKAAVLAEFG
jgi:membrane protease subunit (stomatin/prohibitin family)